MTKTDMSGQYGEAPAVVGDLNLDDAWTEFMHYLYLPVRIPRYDGGRGDFVFPANVAFLEDITRRVVTDAVNVQRGLQDPYVYITARRGFAAPGSPLNRPGWHCDDFGGDDLNYIWTDRFPTRFLLADMPLLISDDDAKSMADMEYQANCAKTNMAGGSMVGFETNVFHNQRIVDGPVNAVVRLTPHVIHDTPIIPAPGGMRSFFKISVSNNRFDLLGNSHNHELDYDWPMTGRDPVRNQPSSKTNRDHFETSYEKDDDA
jgi:hypothetical protein